MGISSVYKKTTVLAFHYFADPYLHFVRHKKSVHYCYFSLYLTYKKCFTNPTPPPPILACVISRYVVENLHYPQNCIRKKKFTHSTPLTPILRMCFPGMLLNTINNLHYHKIAHAKMSCTNTRLLKCFQCLYLASVSHSCVHFLKKNFSLS